MICEKNEPSPLDVLKKEKDTLAFNSDDDWEFGEDCFTPNDLEVTTEELAGRLRVSDSFQEILELFAGDPNVPGFTNRIDLYDPRF